MSADGDPDEGKGKDGEGARYACEIEVDDIVLDCNVTIPANRKGLVIFAHGSGSSRYSPRNRYVATHLNETGLATLLFDLLTPDEEINRMNVFDVGLLGHRLVEVTKWATGRYDLQGLPIGYFGASTGAAAALVAAADLEDEVRAVVSRGGRPDLARGRLEEVGAATLLIVGGHDDVVLELNQEAQDMLTRCKNHLEIVPGASHLFEEPGALERVADLAGNWFRHHLPARIDQPLSG